ncbi:hypothetical protein GQ42DRAFT_64141 [Ramicandelaber brevisporus]|nr:hypothetical protein GQ42DRAFT_64141 [Ramicandelaber brevisporus]
MSSANDLKTAGNAAFAAGNMRRQSSCSPKRLLSIQPTMCSTPTDLPATRRSSSTTWRSKTVRRRLSSSQTGARATVARLLPSMVSDGLTTPKRLIARV